jgi:hypothetical protein
LTSSTGTTASDWSPVPTSWPNKVTQYGSTTKTSSQYGQRRTTATGAITWQALWKSTSICSTNFRYLDRTKEVKKAPITVRSYHIFCEATHRRNLQNYLIR